MSLPTMLPLSVCVFVCVSEREERDTVMCVCMHANDVFTCVMQSVSALLSTRSLCVTFTFTFFSLLGKAVDASVGQPRSHAKLIRNQRFVTALGGAQGIFWRLGLTHKGFNGPAIYHFQTSWRQRSRQERGTDTYTQE